MFLIGCIISAFFGKEGITSFMYAFLNNYIGHILLHDELFFFIPYSIIHHYHHTNTALHIFSILSEFSMMTSFMLLPTIFGIPINPWSIFFNTIVYITIHYINYTYFHINTYHEKHHEQINTNYFPDILDSLMNTKHVHTPMLENTTHMIPNIIICAIITLWLKNKYLPSWKPYLYWFSTILFIILCIYSTFILESSTSTFFAS
jgi:hypothetical protein